MADKTTDRLAAEVGCKLGIVLRPDEATQRNLSFQTFLKARIRLHLSGKISRVVDEVLLQRTEAEIQQAERNGLVNTTDRGLKSAREERRLMGRTAAEIVMIRKDGSKFPCEVSSSLYTDGQGNARSSVVLRDISERKRIEAALRESEARMSAVFLHSPLGIVVAHLVSGIVMSVNDAALRLFDYERDDVVGRRPFTDLATFIYPEQREIILQQLAEIGSTQGLEVDCSTRTGQAIVIEISGRVIEIKDESCVLVMMTDITARKLAESKIQELAYLDTLTHLPNRRLLSDRIQRVMASSERSKFHSAVIYLDLDNFKPLNDAHGHEMGDLLLIEAAQRLKACVRESDTVSRVGGDEFVVLLGELDSSLEISEQQARTVAEKIVTELAAPYILTTQKEDPSGITIEHRCTASVGVAMLSREDGEHKVVLANADAAMYEAKRARENLIRFWTSAVENLNA